MDHDAQQLATAYVESKQDEGSDSQDESQQIVKRRRTTSQISNDQPYPEGAIQQAHRQHARSSFNFIRGDDSSSHASNVGDCTEGPGNQASFHTPSAAPSRGSAPPRPDRSSRPLHFNHFLHDEADISGNENDHLEVEYEEGTPITDESSEPQGSEVQREVDTSLRSRTALEDDINEEHVAEFYDALAIELGYEEEEDGHGDAHDAIYADLSDQGRIIRDAFLKANRSIQVKLRAERACDDEDPIRVQDDVSELSEDLWLEADEREPAALDSGFTSHFAYGFSNKEDVRREVMAKAFRAMGAERRSRAAQQRQEDTGVEETKQGSSHLRYNLNPSTIADYFSSHQCQSNLIISNLRDDCSRASFLLASKGLLEGPDDHEKFLALRYLETELGKKYESEVLDKIKLKGREVRQRSDNPTPDNNGDNWTMSELKRCVQLCNEPRNIGKVFFIYQAHLSIGLEGIIPEPQHADVDIDITGPEVFKPDLIEVFIVKTDTRCTARLRIAEIKASKRVLPKHRIQLGLYSIMLQLWLEKNISEADRPFLQLDQETACVWLLDARWYVETNIGSQQADLMAFLSNGLVHILEHPENATSCGRCRICQRLARAMRSKRGGRLLGLNAEPALIDDLAHCSIVTNYEISLLRDLSRVAWPEEADYRHHGSRLQSIMKALPRLCNVYVRGPLNDPLDTRPIKINSVEVEGDPNWKLCPELIPHDNDEAVIRHHIQQLGALCRCVYVVVSEDRQRVEGVRDAQGVLLAHHIIHQDYDITTCEWASDEVMLISEVKSIDREHQLMELYVVPSADQGHGDTSRMGLPSTHDMAPDDETMDESPDAEWTGVNLIRPQLQEGKESCFIFFQKKRFDHSPPFFHSPDTRPLAPSLC